MRADQARTNHAAIATQALAGAWAVALVLLGLAALNEPGAVWPGWPLAALRALGVAGVAGGQFVFMVLVADRWFRHAWPMMVGVVELLVFVVFLGGLGRAAWALWGVPGGFS